MKVTRSQLKQIIKEEAAAVNELEKPGMLRRLGGMVGLGQRPEVNQAVKDVEKKWKGWRDKLISDAGGDPGMVTFDGEYIGRDNNVTVALDKLFVERQQEFKQIQDEFWSLSSQINTRGFMPDKKQAKRVLTKLTKLSKNARAFSWSLGPQASEAAKSIEAEAKKAAEKKAAAAKARDDAAYAKRRAEEEEEERIKSGARARAKDRADPMSGGWWGSTGEHPGSSATVAHGARGGGRQGTLNRENKKLTLSSLQQIIQEEIAKLNETK